MTSVGILGDGPAVEAIRAALEDTDASPEIVDDQNIAGTGVAVAAGPATEGFDAAVATARESRTPLVVVELGGIGGTAVEDVDAAVSGYAPGTACHNCIAGRVAAAEPETDDGEFDDATARFAGALAGRELVSLVEGRQSLVLGGVVEVPHAQRRVLPLPYCACTLPDEADPEPDEPADLRRDHEPRSLEESLSMAEVAFDRRVGPITEVGEVESYPVPYYLATLGSTPFSDAEAPDHAAGVAVDWDPAFMKAIGEALERYSAAVYRVDDFETAPVAPVDPARIVQPGDPPEASQIESWHAATHLGSGVAVHLPAEIVVYPPPERRIRPAITTGLGFGNGAVDALLSGLYEVVERDAAMLAWYSTYEPLGLNVDDEGYETLTARARSEDLETTALLLTQDVDVPVVAACVHREGAWPRFAAGMSADLDPATAARGALEEALQNWLELRRMGRDEATNASGAIGEKADYPQRVREFVTPETTVPASTVGPDGVSEPPAELETLVRLVREADLDPYAAHLTPRDVEALGFEAVRVVIPEAQPLFTGEAFFGERARVIPAELGFEPQLDRGFHPFP